MSSIPYSTMSFNNDKCIIRFKREVLAVDFFKHLENLQLFFEQEAKQYSNIELNLENTEWFDTLALCYLMMMVYDTKSAKKNTQIEYKFNINDEDSLMFLTFLKDNGFYKAMEETGSIINGSYDGNIEYSNVHKCFFQFTVLTSSEEIISNINSIKKLIYNEFKTELTSSELEYITNKVTYFLKETLDNAFKHGYSEFEYKPICSFLIKQVKSDNAIDLKKYKRQYIDNTPYIDVSLYEDNYEYLEIYVADIGKGLRNSFLEDPIKDTQTDENILDYILTKGERSKRKITSNQTTRYGGLFDIVHMFKNDGDKLGIKADSRWCFTSDAKPKYSRIDDYKQHSYSNAHGFAIVGSINWRRNTLYNNSMKNYYYDILTEKKILNSDSNIWMTKSYRENVSIIDLRFDNEYKFEKSELTIIFPSTYLFKNDLANLILGCNSKCIILSGIHESEYKKYLATINNLRINEINIDLDTIIIITNTLFPSVYFFDQKSKTFEFSNEKTINFVKSEFSNLDVSSIYKSFKSFILWKKVYDSEIVWDLFSRENPIGYINAKVKWDTTVLRGYLDFSQFLLVPICQQICIEQMFKFKMYGDNIYFCSLDRFTEEICEKANRLMNNSRNGEKIWIGSVFVSGKSERNPLDDLRDSNKTYYFFKHIDVSDEKRSVSTLFEWATKGFRLAEWFNPDSFNNSKYERVGNSSFIANEGSRYWLLKRYINYEDIYYKNPSETYDVLQTEFGARPSVLKLGHLDNGDHHDLFEIKTDILFDADMVSSKLVSRFVESSYDYLITQFLRKMIPYVKKNKVFECLNESLSDNEKQIIYNKLKSSKKINSINQEEMGIIVYLNDYETSTIIETIKPLFSKKIQNRIIPIVPFENNYVSSILFVSPLLLERIIQSIKELKNEGEKVVITLFISTSFTTRLEDELRHIFTQMGADSIYVLSLLDRRRLPYGNDTNSNIESYLKLDLPAVGLLSNCPICTANSYLVNLKKFLRDELLIHRIDDILEIWKSTRLSDYYCNNGIEKKLLKSMPSEVQQEMISMKEAYGNLSLNISTDIGLVLFSIENTSLSLSTNFLDICIKSDSISDDLKIMLISSHLLFFDSFQISEMYYLYLIDKICNLLYLQDDISVYTSLAVISLCSLVKYYKYINKKLIEIYNKNDSTSNIDYLLMSLVIYINQEKSENCYLDSKYSAYIRCHLIDNNNALELIYDMLLYVETDYVQSHRQAFSQIISTNSLMPKSVYDKAKQYVLKLNNMYKNDCLSHMFYDNDLYKTNKNIICQKLTEIFELLKEISTNNDHIKIKKELSTLLSLAQNINRENLYFRVPDVLDDNNIINWIDNCKCIAEKRTNITGSVLSIKTNLYDNSNMKEAPNTRPWFYSYSDITEEIVNLISDMLLGKSRNICDFLLSDDSNDSKEEKFDGVVYIEFKKYYLEIYFYNVTSNKKTIEEIRKIKSSKMNRQSTIVFNTFSKMLNVLTENNIACFEWDYVDNLYPFTLQRGEHLFCAMMRIPYVDMGSSFSNQ